MEIPAEAVKKLIDALQEFTEVLVRCAGSGGPPPRSGPPPKSGPIPSCPKCGGKMLLRSRKTDGGQFWGCSSFPECRGIVPIDALKPRTGNAQQTEFAPPPPDDDVPF